MDSERGRMHTYCLPSFFDTQWTQPTASIACAKPVHLPRFVDPPLVALAADLQPLAVAKIFKGVVEAEDASLVFLGKQVRVVPARTCV